MMMGIVVDLEVPMPAANGTFSWKFYLLDIVRPGTDGMDDRGRLSVPEPHRQA
jgi:hypothetical protein